MTNLLTCCIALLVLLGCQACSSPGGTTADDQAVSVGGASARAQIKSAGAGRIVPAVVGIPSDPGPARTYRIGPHDLLKIEVFQVEELSSEERVNDEGLIVMSLIGAVPVGGLTPKDAEGVIAGLLAKDYLQDPQVNVFVEEYASQNITVAGNVIKPGVFPVKGRITLLQAIALAGGVNRLAKPEEVLIFREQRNGTINAYVVDLTRVQEGNLTDPVLIGNDRVVVPESGSAVFFKGVSDTLRGFVTLPVF